MKNADTDAKKMASLQTEQRGGADDDVSDDVLDDVEAAKLFRHFSVDKTTDKNILMSALSALLGPGKPGSGNGRSGARRSTAIANTTLFLVDKNENYEWRANVAALDDVFVDPSHPPVKGTNISFQYFRLFKVFYSFLPFKDKKVKVSIE